MNLVLKNYVAKNGKDAILDTTELSEYLLEHKNSPNYVYQLVLFIKAGNIKDYIGYEENSLNSVSINNILIESQRSTGLTKDIIKALMFDILIACGYNCEYEKYYESDSSIIGNPLENKTEFSINETAFVGYEETKSALKIAIADYEMGLYSQALEIFRRMAKSGNPTSMYYIGLSYSEGRGTEQNKDEAYKWFYLAAKNGEPRAKVKVGDYYYNHDNPVKRDYKKAYENYSGLGVLSVEPKVKAKIVNILNQRKVNLFVLAASGAIVVLMWLFLIFVNTSVHHSTAMLGLGVPLTILSTVIFAVSFYYFFATKYNNIKLFTVVMLLVWFVYPLVLAIN